MPRRAKIYWSREEVKMLLLGVVKYGQSWKFIIEDQNLNAGFIEHNRIQSMLTLKWRQIKKSQGKYEARQDALPNGVCKLLKDVVINEVPDIGARAGNPAATLALRFLQRLYVPLLEEGHNQQQPPVNGVGAGLADGVPQAQINEDIVAVDEWTAHEKLTLLKGIVRHGIDWATIKSHTVFQTKHIDQLKHCWRVILRSQARVAAGALSPMLQGVIVDEIPFVGPNMDRGLEAAMAASCFLDIMRASAVVHPVVHPAVLDSGENDSSRHRSLSLVSGFSAEEGHPAGYSLEDFISEFT